MLLWQHKNERKRHLLWLKLCAGSFFVHLIILLAVFLGYRDGNSVFSFTMSAHMLQQDVEVVLAPSEPSVMPANVQSGKKSATQIASVQKKPTKKIVQKRAVKKTVMKKKPAPTKAAPKKVVQKRVQQSKKVVNQTKAVPKVQPKELAMNQSNAGDDRVQVSYHDARVVHQYKQLQEEFARHWKPPHGVAKTCVCEITSKIGGDGTVVDIEITNSSGVLMYDIAARSTMLAVQLPRWAWATTLVISFKP